MKKKNGTATSIRKGIAGEEGGGKINRPQNPPDTMIAIFA